MLSMRMTFIATTVLFVTLGLSVAAPPSSPATQPESNSAGPLTERQRNLLLQLSNAEANIQAINKALRVTGYKVGVAYDRIENNQKGNDLMNRQGGGPVPWDEFYGRTARDFYSARSWATFDREGNARTVRVKIADDYTQLKRPEQFDYIYKANNDQVARATDQIASLQHDQAALLARRYFHEAEQSRLWATLAWERVSDEEISLRPLYRFQLKGSTTDVGMLRPLVRFLRAVDVMTAFGIDALKVNQAATLTEVNKQVQSAYRVLQKSLADALIAPTVDSHHAKQAESLKALCKSLDEECEVITDNYQKAVDSDAAKEDASKLQYRAELQASMAFFAALTGELDHELSTTAAAWGVSADTGTANPDEASLVKPELAAALLADSNLGPANKPVSLGRVAIIKADYGTDQKTVSIARQIQAALDGDPFMPVEAANCWADPAPSQKKKLSLQYRIGDTTQIVEIQEDEICLVPLIPKDGLLVAGASVPFKVVAARYGLDDRWIDATTVIRAEVTGPSQAIQVRNFAGEGIDLHSGRHKHLVVYFETGGRRYARIANEGDVTTLMPNP